MVGIPPFQMNDVQVTYKKIQKSEYSFPDSPALSECAKNFISSLLVLDPSKRLTCEQMLNHPFLRTQGEIPEEMPLSPSKNWSRMKFMYKKFLEIILIFE